MKKAAPVDLDNLRDVFQPCRSCLFWQTAEKVNVPHITKDGKFRKEEWLSTTLLKWGNCASVMIEDDEVVGFAQYGLISDFPQVNNFSTGNISKDAAFLACLYILPHEQSKKKGKFLLREILKDFTMMRFPAVETIAKRAMLNKNEFNQRNIDFYLSEGFRIIQDHPVYPRLRIDLKNAVTWKEEITSAFQKIRSPLKKRNQAPAPI